MSDHPDDYPDADRTTHSPSPRPGPAPGSGDEPMEEIVDDVRQILGVEGLSDAMRERMQHAIDAMSLDAAATGVATPDDSRAATRDDAGDLSRLPECTGLPCGDVQDVAARVIADAQRTGDEIVAAAHRVAAGVTEAAMVEASRSLQRAHRAGRLPGQTESVSDDPTGDAAGAEATGAEATGSAADATGQHWYARLSEAGVFFPVAQAAVTRTLSSYTTVLGEALGSGDAAAVARRVGAELIALGVNQPQTLEHTLTVVAEHLSGGPEAPGSVAEVLAALAAGYATELRDDVLRQQESLQLAARIAVEQSDLSLRVSAAYFRRLAWYDALTGLASRTLLLQRLQQTATRDGAPLRRVGLCLIDLVRFSTVNTRYGFDTGDRVLLNVATILRATTAHDGPVRPDYLLARAGSDEFAILVEQSAGVAHMVEIAEKVHEALSLPVEVHGAAVKVKARVGIVVVAANQADGNTMLLNAEAAVRRARASKTGWAVHEDPAASAAHCAVPATADLETVPLTFQPVLAVPDHTIRGMCAIAWWRHPRLGDLDLRRVGELTGNRNLVTELAQHLLQQACTRAAQWPDVAGDPYLSLDLPVHQIGTGTLVDLLLDALGDTGLRPHRLQLQLSGADVTPVEAHSNAWLTRLASLGVRLALDDFGTGTTNLARLRDLPIHEIRTPARVLTSNAMDSRHADQGLLSAMATVAHSMNLDLTVHSVDTQAHADALVGTGCDAVQGMQYTEPILPDACPDGLTPPPHQAPDSRHQPATTTA